MILKCHYCQKSFNHYGNYGVVWCTPKCKEKDRLKRKNKDNKLRNEGGTKWKRTKIHSFSSGADQV